VKTNPVLICLLLVCNCGHGPEPTTAEPTLFSLTDALRPTRGRFIDGWGPSDRERPADLTALLDHYVAWHLLEDDGTAQPDTVLSIALFDLLDGKPDRAIAVLEEGLSAFPGDITLVNALAVVLFEERHRLPDGLFRAGYLLSERARESDRPEIHFNAGLVFKALGLAEDSRRAFETALTYEDNAAWREDIERHLSQNDQKSDDPFPLEFRHHFFENTLLPWAQNTGDGEGIQRIEDAREHILTDPFLEHVVAEILNADEPTRSRLAELMLAHDSAQRAYTAFEYDEGRPLLTSSNAIAADLGSVWQAHTMFLAALYAYQASRYAEALDLLENSRTLAALYGDPLLLGRIARQRGVILAILNEPDKALMAYRQARVWFEKTGDRGLAADTNSLIAGLSSQLGDQPGAERCTVAALADLEAIIDAKHRLITLEAGLDRVREHRAHDLARRFIQPIVTTAERTGSPEVTATYLAEMADVSHQLGDHDNTTRYLAGAKRELPRIEDAGTRAITRSDIARIEAGITVDRDPDHALGLCDLIQKIYQTTDNLHEIPHLHLLRARAFLNRGDTEQAIDQMERAVDVFAEMSRQDIDRTIRIRFLELLRARTDQLFLLQSADLAVAFETMERFRTSVFGRAPVLSNASLRDRVAPETAILDLVLIDDQLFSRLITRENFLVRRVPDPEERIALMSQPSSFWQHGDHIRELDLISETLLQALPNEGINTLIIIADKALTRFPCALLRRDDRWLINDIAVGLATSASGYVTRDRSPIALSPALVIGDPAIAPSMGLPRLPHAREEAETIAEILPGTVLLTETEATKQAFLEQATHAKVIHFAGHAEQNPANPDFSRLYFAGDGILYAHEIAKMDLGGVDLVVLSGCETRSGPISSATGMRGLENAFIEAGARNIMTNSWMIEDLETKPTLFNFYKALKENTNTSAAHRKAQRNSLDMRKSPIHWAVKSIIHQ